MKQHTILVIDDQPDNLKIIVDYLKESGVDYTILKAPNGKIACKIAEKKIPDLIITDWEMPEMDGIETIKCLQGNKDTRDIPVIMASGVMTLPKNLKTALEAGAVDYIKKPVDKTELIARVNSMLKLADSYKEIKLLNATKDKFFSIIAHDLRSPFNAMLGFSDLLVKKYDKYSSIEQKNHLDVLNKEIRNTHKLVENLLLWARTQRKNIKFNPQEESLYEIVNENIRFLDQIALNKSISVKTDIAEKVVVFADKDMLHTIMRNLISNAIKFTPKNGEIIVSANAKTTDSNQDVIEVKVKDNGIGISDDEQTKLFSIADNISTKGTDDERGSGLGLILCKEFVENHGGEIGLESELGQGTTFWFCLPMHGC